MIVDLRSLRLHQGGHLLVKRALQALPIGEVITVQGEDPELSLHLRAWARAQGHGFQEPATLRKGDAERSRWAQAHLAGTAGVDGVVDYAQAQWGVAARGAQVEAGLPPLPFALSQRQQVWSPQAPRMYAQAAAAQWDPETAIPWDAPISHPEEVEDAVVQVMTYLIENETVALLVPARFLAQVHPHFREILQVLAIQVADEARHIEVFSRRAGLRRERLGRSTAGGQASLRTLLEEPDFALASFLLSVLGEGSFLELLRFLHTHAPDAITAAVVRLSAQDEARHVAFGLAHLEAHLEADPDLRPRLAAAVHQRHAALQHTAGLNAEVFDALTLLAAGGWEPERIAAGHAAVVQLSVDMDRGRRARLQRLGFDREQAAALSALHTRNFM
ncbi:MAG: ferritin-like domain-containing protein [Myxococcota bacterium]|nr:ferritin-like domain-containing protein [Myxococcota bacterium]